MYQQLEKRAKIARFELEKEKTCCGAAWTEEDKPSNVAACKQVIDAFEKFKASCDGQLMHSVSSRRHVSSAMDSPASCVEDAVPMIVDPPVAV